MFTEGNNLIIVGMHHAYYNHKHRSYDTKCIYTVAYRGACVQRFSGGLRYNILQSVKHNYKTI